MTTKEKLITKLNKYFELDIPLSIRAVTHQQKMKYSWYIKYYDTSLCKWLIYGSKLTMTKLLNHSEFELTENLKHNEFELFKDTQRMYDITPK